MKSTIPELLKAAGRENDIRGFRVYSRDTNQYYRLSSKGPRKGYFHVWREDAGMGTANVNGERRVWEATEQKQVRIQLTPRPDLVQSAERMKFYLERGQGTLYDWDDIDALILSAETYGYEVYFARKGERTLNLKEAKALRATGEDIRPRRPEDLAQGV
jgi:hypothetical protein